MDRLARLLDAGLATGRVGSAAAVSVGDGGREIFRHVTGRVRHLPDPGAEITGATPFDLASVTKPMATVSIAMVLVARGLLDLDAPVRRYLPAAATLGTVRQLLGHSAGCAAHVEFFRRLRVESHADPRAVLVDRAQREPCQPPGVAAVYSDLGFIQLGAVLERAAERPLEQLFADLVAGPLGLSSARYAGTTPIHGAVATELDDRGLVCGLVHDENCHAGGGVAGHAGLFGSIIDVGTWCAALVDTCAGTARGVFTSEIAQRFITDTPLAGAAWRLGWDTPSPTPGVSQAGDRWPRTGAVGHTGYTGTSVWLDIANRRWVALLTNRVHPTRHNATADAIKALRRAVGDMVVDILS
jgi:CubicO group peptidase (beta-lactamase class C family)